ncbi:hypothetical protein ACLKA6_008179 [Drosophila palustris]
MCPKTSKTTPLLLIGGIVFVIILVAITGITLINNINLSNIIRLNEKVASDSVSANDNQIKELNYVNNHPKNLNVKQHNNDTDEPGDARSEDQIRQEMSSLIETEAESESEPKLSAVIWQNAQKSQFLDKANVSMTPPSLSSSPSPSLSSSSSQALPLGGATDTPSGGDDLIDYEKRAQIVKPAVGSLYLSFPTSGLEWAVITLRFYDSSAVSRPWQTRR